MLVFFPPDIAERYERQWVERKDSVFISRLQSLDVLVLTGGWGLKHT